LAQSFAERIWNSAGDDRLRQIETAYRMTAAREPTSEEREIALESLRALEREWARHGDIDPASARRKALENLCHALFNSAAQAQARELQAGLNKLGYDAGAVDGIIGRGTRGALQKFQKDKGLVADGFPTTEMLARVASEAA
jgi:hypothetical protein